MFGANVKRYYYFIAQQVVFNAGVVDKIKAFAYDRRCGQWRRGNDRNRPLSRVRLLLSYYIIKCTYALPFILTPSSSSSSSVERIFYTETIKTVCD